LHIGKFCVIIDSHRFSMSTIRILPDQVANRIAAGEVIERPVAVVKELVDNSIDANASEIRIHFLKGGKSLIRVEDDGIGMSSDDALLCLERHATSKISNSEDLFKIQTLGFRGEAVPSIASVARFLLQTRRESDTEGTEILVNGGKLIHRKAVGTPTGTRIEVSHLFSSIPVRRKFLKTDNTEAAHIVQWIRLIAVAHPAVRFRLQSGSKTVFSLPKNQTLFERIESLWGKAIREELMEFSFEGEGVEANGFIGKAGVSRPSRQDIIAIVNGRPVESRTLGFAFTEAYHTHIPKGRYPVVFVNIVIDPSAIDVNIHPSKKEIKFKDEGRIRTLVIQSVWKHLKVTASPVDSIQINPSHTSRLPTDERDIAARTVSIAPPSRAITGASIVGNSTAPSDRPAVSNKEVNAEIRSGPQSAPQRPKTTALEREWRYIGHYARAFSLFERSTGLCLVHSSRAKKRIEYEKILGVIQKGALETQQEMIPLTFELDVNRSRLLLSWLPILSSCGIGVEEFGRNFFRLEQAPAFLNPQHLHGWISDQLALGADHSLPSCEAINKAMALMYCEAQANYVELPLQKETALDLLASLLACIQPMVDPNGKRIVCDLPHRILDPSE
jgi:DNA mismatch repair protein MutL